MDLFLTVIIEVGDNKQDKLENQQREFKWGQKSTQYVISSKREL